MTALAPEESGISSPSGIAPSAVKKAVAVPTAASASWWQRGALAAGVVGLCVLVRALPHAGWPTLLARLGPVLPLVCGVALGWMASYARGLRGILGGAVGWGRLFYNRVVGEAYNVVMPFGDVGGDPLRILDLGAEVGTARAVRAIVLDRLTYATSGLLFSALTSLGAVHVFAWDSRIERLLTGYAMMALPAAAVVSLVATRPESGRLVARLLGLVKVRVPEMPSALPTRVFLRALGWNLLGRAGVMAEVALLLLALGQQVRLDALVAIAAMLSVAGMVFFFIPNGIGVNEGATVLALELTGYGKGVGLAVGLARRVRQLLLAAAGVAVSALWRPGRPSAVSSVVSSVVSSGP
jgi:hypothetical protein